jgi:hypothetical protein
MASIARRSDGHWRARYRDPAGKHTPATFNARFEAERWLENVTTAMTTGIYVDPAGRATVSIWGARRCSNTPVKTRSSSPRILTIKERSAMASIEKRTRNGGSVWRAHYRTPDGGQRNKTFLRKIDAERFLTMVESAKLSGSFSDPALARLTTGEWSARWLAGQAHLKPSTRERYAGILREHVDPKWSNVRLADVRHVDVQAWVSELAERRSASTARKRIEFSRWYSRWRCETTGWRAIRPEGLACRARS